MRENVCLFIPKRNDNNIIHSINFVLESNPQPYCNPSTQSVYKMYFVASGEGVIHTPKADYKIKSGDVFFTFSHIGSLLPEFNKKTKPENELSLYIKKIINDSFTSSEFSLETISRELSYNKKYLSATFKKHTGIGISEYLNTVRIQNARTLMEQGFTSVSDIAHSCGFLTRSIFQRFLKSNRALRLCNI